MLPGACLSPVWRALLAVALLAAGCAQAPAPPQPTPAPALPTATPAPEPPGSVRLGAVVLPRDEAPHDDLTEWWYYTGHVFTPTGRRYGFELVVFQSVRGLGPVGYAAHVAITDGAARRFVHAAQSVQARKVQRGSAPGFDLRVGDWRMHGLNGRDGLSFAVDKYRLQLDLDALKPPVAHAGGLVSFGIAGDSYYYSRTRLAVQGTLEVDGQRMPVTGQAWFDKQWGNFLVYPQGGWDWFAVQLNDGSDLMLSLVRDAEQQPIMTYGTLVDPAGHDTHLSAEQCQVAALDRWQSPRSGATYPSGWRVVVPAQGLDVTVTPVLRDQELLADEATGLTYWEGESLVSGTHAGRAVRGLAYVELTGYAP